MEVDPVDAAQKALEESEADSAAARRLNNAVAITVAIIATFMGICKVKDDNICQAMQQAQADRLDHWSWYQAHNIRHEVMKSTAATLRADAAANAGVDKAALESVAARYDELAKKQEADMVEKKEKAEGFQSSYDQLNYRDDQFDLMESALAIAISLLAVTSLTRATWLYWLSLVPAACGFIMGLAGLFGWPIHPNLIASWLGA